MVVAEADAAERMMHYRCKSWQISAGIPVFIIKFFAEKNKSGTKGAANTSEPEAHLAQLKM
ncbi:MAG: hypothetical protein QME75_05710 [Deltaproteobacteria bacterium]|nr:hypothetical protein [Deltaproteobacteria bacterium]